MAKKSRNTSAAGAKSPSPATTTASTKAAGSQAASTARTPQTRAERQARRPEIIQQRKEDRQRVYQKQKRQALYTKIGFGVLAALVLIGGVAWGFNKWGQSDVSGDVQTYFGAADFAGLHKDGQILYEEVPPVGGPHNAVWQNCGYYSQYLNNVNAVHALEHGAVWITYDPSKMSEKDIQTLKDKTKQTYVLVSPYPGMSAPVIASVWGKQIKLNGASDSRLDAFIKKYRQNPDNTPERGAYCTLGTSATTSTAPQTVPYVRVNGSKPVGGVTIAEATATAQAQLAATPPATPTTGGPGTPPVVGPIPSPAASPKASPVASPQATSTPK